MRLDQELVQRKLVGSRTEAQELISSGSVLVNEITCTKQTRQTTEEDIIKVTARRQFVSRGGEKLQGVLRDVYLNTEVSSNNISESVSSSRMRGSSVSNLNDDHIHMTCSGKSALDIGSSTGGFTDCLLSYGICHVDAVDVGTLQLHNKLRNDERVTLYENTDIRNFQQALSLSRQDLDNHQNRKKYDIIVADLSFIPLTHVMDDIVRLSSEGTECFLLIKPQFEVGKGNTKKGIVKDESLVQEVLENYRQIVKEKGMNRVEIYPSHIEGGDGNQEYFLYGSL